MDRPLERSWLQQKNELAKELPAQQFQTWLKPVQFVSSTEAGKAPHITLSVPSEFHRDWVDREFGSLIQASVERSAGVGASYSFIVAAQKRDEAVELVSATANVGQATRHAVGASDQSFGSNSGVSKETSRVSSSNQTASRANAGSHSTSQTRFGNGSRQEVGPANGPGFKIRPEMVPGSLPNTLNPKYTFDTFIEADCNRLARSAGVAVSNRPGETSFNPFKVRRYK